MSNIEKWIEKKMQIRAENQQLKKITQRNRKLHELEPEVFPDKLPATVDAIKKREKYVINVLAKQNVRASFPVSRS